MTRYLDMSELFTEVQRRQRPWEINLYDLLRKLATGGQWTEEERAGAVRLIDDLEAVGVFGTTAATIKETGGE